MTIASVIIAPDHAIVSADTALHDGRHTTKLFALPHVHAVLVGRGDILFEVSLLHRCLAVSDFDALLDELPWSVPEVWKETNAPGASQIALIGQSRGILMHREPTAKGFSILDLDRPGALAMPAVADSVLETRDPLVIAKAQLEHCRRVDPEGLYGGRLIGATITRDSITIASLGVLE